MEGVGKLSSTWNDRSVKRNESIIDLNKKVYRDFFFLFFVFLFFWRAILKYRKESHTHKTKSESWNGTQAIYIII